MTDKPDNEPGQAKESPQKKGGEAAHAAAGDSSSKWKQWAFSTVGVVIAIVIVVAVNYIARSLPVSADFTENQVYTLSDGTKKILETVDGKGLPVTINLYVTQNEDAPPFIRVRATEVESFLRLYARKSEQVEVQKYNPEDDPDIEEAAQLAGITPRRTRGGDPIFFGIAITSLGEKVVLPFVPAVRDEMLEYELSRAISQVTTENKPVIGLMTGFNVQGGFSGAPQFGGRPEPAWAIYSELEKDFEVRSLGEDVEEIEDDITVLIVLHPGAITEAAMFAVDQFVLRGGKLVAMVDPLSFAARSQQPQQNPLQPAPAPSGPPETSNLEKLLSAWGYKFVSDKVVADLNYPTPLQTGERSPTVLSLGPKAINREDPLTNELSDLLLPFAGEFTGEPVKGLEKTVLISSSVNSSAVPSATAMGNTDGIMRDFQASGESKTLALRLHGTFPTGFPDGAPGGDDESETDKEDGGEEDPEKEGEDAGDENEEEEEKEPGHLTESAKESTVVLFGDSDFVFDMFCIQRGNFLGQQFSQLVNGNLPLVLNVVEQLAGDTALVSIRSRASMRRPFTRIAEMKADAEEQVRKEGRTLQEKIDEANRRLQELSSEQDPSQRALIPKALQEEQRKLQRDLIETEREQREIEKKARRKLNSLLARIKGYNMFLVPVLVALVGLAVFFVRRAKTSAR